MKKLLICSPCHALYGGVESIIGNLCRNLPARGWEPLLALGKGARFNDVDRYRKVYPDLPIVEIDGTKGTRQARIEELIHLMHGVMPDVVLSARIFEVCEAVTELKSRGGGPRLVYAVRAYEPPYIHDVGLYQRIIDMCVTSGELVAAACRILGGMPPERVASIAGGVRPVVAPVAPRVPKGMLRLGYVGRLDQEQKRIFDLVPFLEALDRRQVLYTLDIIGVGPAEHELKTKLSRWLASERVVFHGWQDQDTLYHRHFPAMDCIVHFAGFEGVTIAPREAMVHGVVPVISRFIGLASEQQFRHEENSLTFPTGDTECAASHISRLATEPALLTSLSLNAMNSQTGDYTFSGAMDAWAEAFDRCMGLPLQNGPTPRLDRSEKGILTRLGIPPGLAQRLRDIVGKRPVYNDPGSEWPTSSGLLTKEASEKIMRFASEHERELERTNAGFICSRQ